MLKFLRESVDSKIGKTVIHFTTHGCMATEHEFDYIGTIIGIEREVNYIGRMYKVKVLKDRQGELRDNNVTEKIELVASWYLQDLGGDFYIAYD